MPPYFTDEWNPPIHSEASSSRYTQSQATRCKHLSPFTMHAACTVYLATTSRSAGKATTLENKLPKQHSLITVACPAYDPKVTNQHLCTMWPINLPWILSCNSSSWCQGPTLWHMQHAMCFKACTKPKQSVNLALFKGLHKLDVNQGTQSPPPHRTQTGRQTIDKMTQ